MQQAALLDGLSLDALAFLQDGLTAAEVDIGWCEMSGVRAHETAEAG